MKALALAIVVAVGCDAGQGTLHRHRDPGALVVAEAADVISLDPARVTDSESIQVGELLFEGLVGWKSGTTDIEPQLATRWEVAPDGMTWTFHLRDHVAFHDGSPLDAEAVKFSFDRLLDANNPDYLAEAGGYWRSLLQDVARVVVVDPLTVEIHVSRPYSPLLGDLAKYPIVSPTAVKRWGAAFGMHPVGTGPYKLEAWNTGERVVVKRFEGYWGAAPGLERVVFLVVVDARQRLVDLEAGSVDLATAILPDETSFVELHPDLQLYPTAGNDVCYLAFNTLHPPFDDVRVRRAANFAINKEPIIKLGYSGRAIAADGPLPPTQWGYHASATKYPYDPAAAKKLLAEAAADGTFDPNKVYQLYAMSTPRPYLPSPERVARLLQGALAQVGLKTELVLQPYQQHRSALQKGDHDLAVFGWVGDTGDPDNFLYVLFDSQNAHAGDAQNIAFYQQPEVDKMLAQAQATSDERTRTALYATIQDRIADDAPWVPITHSELVVAARVELEHVTLSPTGHPIFAQIMRAEPR
jgi:peptide/nickel transport system substrate-binding protein